MSLGRTWLNILEPHSNSPSETLSLFPTTSVIIVNQKEIVKEQPLTPTTSEPSLEVVLSHNEIKECIVEHARLVKRSLRRKTTRRAELKVKNPRALAKLPPFPTPISLTQVSATPTHFE
ncbi:hypothetical protein L6452_43523 [Arctium lappa]|uniref:Uncharacterized protein n=1 Tax=Arctium lappa TaxID=4217 RepID=A0ACB8XDE7_ARCLA|nr:hypothetical protein L6452_43523 [Arctium lappa]